MPDAWKPKLTEVYIQWADFVLNHGKDVTDWEQTFTKDIRRQLEYKPISRRQAEILERIYAEKT